MLRWRISPCIPLRQPISILSRRVTSSFFSIFFPHKLLKRVSERLRTSCAFCRQLSIDTIHCVPHTTLQPKTRGLSLSGMSTSRVQGFPISLNTVQTLEHVHA